MQPMLQPSNLKDKPSWFVIIWCQWKAFAGMLLSALMLKSLQQRIQLQSWILTTHLPFFSLLYSSISCFNYSTSLKSRPRCARKDLNNKDTSNLERKMKRLDRISRIRSQILTKNEWSDCWSKRDRTDDMFWETMNEWVSESVTKGSFSDASVLFISLWR